MFAAVGQLRRRARLPASLRVRAISFAGAHSPREEQQFLRPRSFQIGVCPSSQLQVPVAFGVSTGTPHLMKQMALRALLRVNSGARVLQTHSFALYNVAHTALSRQIVLPSTFGQQRCCLATASNASDNKLTVASMAERKQASSQLVLQAIELRHCDPFLCVSVFTRLPYVSVYSSFFRSSLPFCNCVNQDNPQ